jgi:hypothetical protein
VCCGEAEEDDADTPAIKETVALANSDSACVFVDVTKGDDTLFLCQHASQLGRQGEEVPMEARAIPRPAQ